MIEGGSSTPQKGKNHVDFKSSFHFQTPVWVAEAPMFLKNAIKVSNKYIKKAEKLLKDKLKNEPKWKKDIGTFGLSKHSENMSNDPSIKDLVQFVGQRSYEFLDWQGFNLQNHSLHFTEFWVQEFSEKGGGHHDTHVHQFTVDPGLEPFRFIHFNIKVVETAISKERSNTNELSKK
jgi:hypothetical protein